MTTQTSAADRPLEPRRRACAVAAAASRSRSGRPTSAPPASGRSRSSTTWPPPGRPGRVDDRGATGGHLALPGAAAGRRAAGAGPGRRLDRRSCAADRLGRGARDRPALAQGRQPQPDPLVQGPGRGRGRRQGGRVRLRHAGLRLDRQPGRRDGGRGGGGRPAEPTSSSPPTSSRPRSTTPSPTARRSCRSHGTYDQVNRLSLEVADERAWAFVNVNLRPYYAEGSKTLAFEIAEELGWRLPDVVVAPHRLRLALHQDRQGLRRAGRRSASSRRRPVRFVGGQAAGCAPVATAFGRHLGHRAGRAARHDRPFAGHRQPGRRALRPRARSRERRLDRVDPGQRDGRGHPSRGRT